MLSTDHSKQCCQKLSLMPDCGKAWMAVDGKMSFCISTNSRSISILQPYSLASLIDVLVYLFIFH